MMIRNFFSLKKHAKLVKNAVYAVISEDMVKLVVLTCLLCVWGFLPRTYCFSPCDITSFVMYHISMSNM